MTPEAGPRNLLPFLATLVAALAFLALQDRAYVLAGAVFEYPLDDPYIHLAMAEQIAAGNYGVNPGERAAAASSPLYPFLLLPFAGEPLQRFLPLVWNIVGLACSAWLWGLILWRAGWGGGWIGVALALTGPILLHMPGLAFTGMEHSLHMAASLAIVLGLLRFLDEDRVVGILWVGVLLAPLLRPEGLALAGAAGVVVAVRGRRVAGAGLIALTVLPVAAFAYGLTLLGLEPVPSSITAKIGDTPVGEGGLLHALRERLDTVFVSGAVRSIVIFLLIAANLLILPVTRRSPRVWLLVAAAVAGTAHLIAGDFGWMDRYETYVVATLAAALFATVAFRFDWARLALVLIPYLHLAMVYPPDTLHIYPWAPRAVHLQSAQIARLVQDHLREPVAVNDLGRVSWRNPNYVLDLWGLADDTARQLRLAGGDFRWIDDLTDARGVKLALIYAHWFPGGPAPDWVELGRLTVEGSRGYLSANTVTIYLTGDHDSRRYVDALRAWQAGLPAGARFAFAGQVGE